VPLLLLERDHPLPTLRVCADDASWVLLDEPYCGCDACDDGSEAALRSIDETIVWFLQGPYVLLRGPGWTFSWHPRGAQAGGTAGRSSFDDLRTASRRMAAGEPVELPPDAELVVSQSWLT